MYGPSSAMPRLRAPYPRLLRRLNKPYYLLRPGQVVARLRATGRTAAGGTHLEAELPWGVPYRFRAHEKTGLEISRRGLFDLTVSEVLFRLTDPGEVAVDVGANTGHMTSLLGVRAGPDGRVLAFEPHPALFAELAWNVERWTARPDFARVELLQLALSGAKGVAPLRMAAGFDWNMGSATLERDGEDAGGGERAVEVPVRRLDDVLADEDIGVMKVDVEGHEPQVFEGASALLAAGRIRDVVFEDFGAPPTPAMRYLEGLGYATFSLDQALLGPIAGPRSARSARRSGADPSYLATRDPRRAVQRLRARGWACLGVGAPARR